MQYKASDGFGIGLSCVSLGGWQLGGHGWGKISDIEMGNAVQNAIDGGVNVIDTAPIYGLGHSEEVLGNVLGSSRKRIVVATKVGLVWTNKNGFDKHIDNSAANIEKEIDLSLRRLKTDYIDIYQVHYPDPNTPIEDTMFAMEKLRDAGKIRRIGFCNLSLALLKEALKFGRINTVQIPYNLVDREAERELLPFCRENGIGVLTHSSIAGGLLTGKYGRGTKFEPDDHRSKNEDRYFAGEAFLKHLSIVEKVKAVAQRLGRTPAQVAIRWVLENPCVTSAIFGAKTAEQVEENVAASDIVLSREDMKLLCEGT